MYIYIDRYILVVFTILLHFVDWCYCQNRIALGQLVRLVLAGKLCAYGGVSLHKRCTQALGPYQGSPGTPNNNVGIRRSLKKPIYNPACADRNLYRNLYSNFYIIIYIYIYSNLYIITYNMCIYIYIYIY